METAHGERLRYTGRESRRGKPAAASGHGRQFRPDGASIAGLLAGLALLVTAVAIGGETAAFFDVRSLLIVLGGTFAVVSMCFSPADVASMLRVVTTTLARAAPQPSGMALQVLQLADEARRLGVLNLESRLAEHEGNPFLHKAIALVIDGLGEADIESVLRYELQATSQRYRRSAAVLRKCAEYAPAMGLIGTLVGLVQMLGRLDQPHHIGPSMAIALLTTLYGAVLANMVFSPLAVKLERAARDEELICTLYMLGAMSMSRQENPRRLELLFNSVLPPGQRLHYFD
jgi:chemotaxis protein MotA